MNPSDFTYGFYRVPKEKVLELDMTHVKRIRPALDNGAKLEILVTSKSHLVMLDQGLKG